MSSVARHVRYHVCRDPNLHLGLTRDVISHAKLARWLQREKGLAGSENAIIAALRRMDMDEEKDPLKDAREIAKGLTFTIEDDWIAIECRVVETSSRLGELLDELGELPVLPNGDSVVVILEAQDRDRAEEILGDYLKKTVHEGLALVEVSLPKDTDISGVHSLIRYRMTLKGVSIKESHTSGNAIRFFIPEEHKARTEDLLTDLADD